MPILSLYQNSSDLGGVGVNETVNTASFDGTYVANSVKLADNQSGPTLSPGAGVFPDLWFHFDVYADNSTITGSSTDGQWFTISIAGNTFVRANLANGFVEYGISNGGVSFTNSALILVPFSLNRMTFDIRVRLSDAGSDYLTIYHNGILYAEVSIAATGSTSVQSILFNNADINSNIFYSQMIVADESTLGLKLSPMYPNAAGTVGAWTGDYTALAASNNGLSISSNVAGEEENWNLGAYIGPAAPAGIRGVYMQSNAAKGLISGPTGFQHSLEIGGTKYYGSTIVDPEMSKQSITSWALDPATGLAWDASAFAALIAGVKSIT